MSFNDCGAKLIINERPTPGSVSLPIYCDLTEDSMYTTTVMPNCDAYDCSVECPARINGTTKCPTCGKDFNSESHHIPVCDMFNCECGCRVMTCHGVVTGYASHKLVDDKDDTV